MSRFTDAVHSTSAWMGIVSAFMLVWLVWLITPDRPFMYVESVEVSGHAVTANREIYAESLIADWLVTVVPFDLDNPACKTIQGQNLHEGWSIYEGKPLSESSMHIDVWVGQVGCADRLIAGHDYKMYVTWTPRDGSPPVTHRTTFRWFG